MAKKDIHPIKHDITVVLSNGKDINIKTTWGKENDVIKLDIDPTNHPAWKKNTGTFVNTNNDQVSKFKKKYGTLFNY